jgi:hypothetical protein
MGSHSAPGKRLRSQKADEIDESQGFLMLISWRQVKLNQRASSSGSPLGFQIVRNLKHILTVLTLVAWVWGCPAHAATGRPSAAATGGTDNYTITFAGCLTGKGNATSTGTSLSITGNVTDDSGNKGTFTATNLVIDAKLHFTGTGTALGQTVSLSGRLDAAPPGQETALKTQRIVCTFTTNKGASNEGHGRIAGYVPVTPTTPAKGGGSGGGSGGGTGGGSGGGGGDSGGGGTSSGGGGSGGGDKDGPPKRSPPGHDR